MKLKNDLTKYAYRACILIGGMFTLAIIITGANCGFSFGDTCPTPQAKIWLGALVGAVTTAFFFYVIDDDAKNTLKKFDRLPVSRKKVLAWLAVFVIIIFSLTIIGTDTYCSFSSDDACPTPEVEVWLGALVGAVTTALFFFLISRNITSALEKLGKLYVARTCALNLMDIFGKENGMGRIKKSEKNRLYFLKILKEDYIDTFHIEKGTIKEIYDAAEKHGPVDENHDHNACERTPSCKDVMNKIKKFNGEEKNTIEKGAEPNDWMNPK